MMSTLICLRIHHTHGCYYVEHFGDALIIKKPAAQGRDMIDLGCRSGYFTIKMRELFEGKVIEVDLSLGLITPAQSYLYYQDIEYVKTTSLKTLND